jgi:multidrug resistance protein, MATE family
LDYLILHLVINSSVVTNSAYYVLGVPLGLYLTFTWHLGIHGLWIGLTFSLVYCSALGSWVCWRTDWGKEVVKVIQRLKEEDQARRDLEERAMGTDDERRGG